MRAPDFWSRDGWPARALAPLAALYAWGGRRRRLGAEPFTAALPVICVGNIVAGGAGKTPVCLAVAERLRRRGREVHFLTRGHGGTEVGPRLVDPVRHDAARVGDEALLLAAQAPTWVARWRPDGAVAAAELGAHGLVMDDGFQNGTLHQDLALVVVDGGYGYGNGRVIPAGPCREPMAEGLARAHALVLVGEDRAGVAAGAGALPVLRAHLRPGPEAVGFRGARLFAFAGIGRPDKFFATLRQCGAHLAAARSFPDHHPYRRGEIADLLAEARALGARPVTTAKDAVRLPADLRDEVAVLNVRLVWEDEAALDSLLERLPWP